MFILGLRSKLRVETAMAAAALAAGARDATCLESLVGHIYIYILFIALIFFRSSQRVETAIAAAVVRDSKVSNPVLFYIYIILH